MEQWKMEKQSRLFMWALVVLPVVGAILAIIPPQKKLKGGIDLAGGFSMLYEIDTTGLTRDEIRQGGGLASRMIRILQERVDPNAQLNLIWRPVGATRIEVQMPRPPQEAIERRAEYEAALAKIDERNIGRLEVETALSADPSVRDERLDQLVRGVSERAELLETLKEAHDAYRRLQDTDDIEAEDAAFETYERAMDELLATSLDPGRLTDVLNLGNSQNRAEQIGRLKEQYSAYADIIEETTQKYDEWKADKAALEDPSDLKRLLRGAGVLEFRILADRNPQNPNMIEAEEAALKQPISRYVEQLKQYGPRPRGGDRYRWFEVSDIRGFLQVDSDAEMERAVEAGTQIVAEYLGKWYVLAHADDRYGLLKKEDSRWRLTGARPHRDQNGRPAVLFMLDPKGGSLFGTLTSNNIGRQLCIFLDDVAMSHAVIRSRITTSGTISGGSFTQDKVIQLVQVLEAGSLPGRLKETPLMEKNVGPSLGATNRRLGLNAAIYGLIAVAIFIVIYYRLAGVVADVALFLNLLFVLGIMATLEATFTLPGIAGLILTVGMAVDANVLIFERYREERERGTVFKRALRTGYEKALSTIVDANLTTLITCVVLGYLGSEEVKGFAMTLGFGIVTSMFTALFVTRLIFLSLMDIGWLKDLKMARLIGQPSVDWLKLRRTFWPISLIAVLGGMALFSSASAGDPESVYDIEFLGGTSVQIELAGDVEYTDEEMREIVTSAEPVDGQQTAVTWLEQAADRLRQAKVSAGQSQTQFVVSMPELTGSQIAALMQVEPRGMERSLVDLLVVGGVDIEAHSVTFDTRSVEVEAATQDKDAVERSLTLDEFKNYVTAAADYTDRAAGLMRGARIQTVSDVGETTEGQAHDAYEIITVETNKELVKEAVVAVLGDKLEIERPVNFVHVTSERHPQGLFPIEEDSRYLSDVIGGDANYDVRRFKGGVVLVFDELTPPQSRADIDRRIREIRLQPGFDEAYKWRDYEIFGLQSAGSDGGDPRFTKFALAVVDENLPYYDDPDRWLEQVAQPELEQATQALQAEKTLRKVIQFAPQVADQVKNDTIIAIAVALTAIVAYVWIRFGSMQFGLAAIVALVHDVAITLGFITLSDYFHGGKFGELLLIRDFKIDLPMIAAMLTIIGYSLNDTIVIFDRIRENRGKLATLSPQIINTSINQTLSRTLLTSITTWVVVAIMYWFGGPGVRGFAYALLMGVVVGTYSTLAVATPLLYRPRVLNIVVFLLIALGVVGATAVMSAGNLTIILIVGILTLIALIAAIVLELRSDRDYGVVGTPA